MRSGADHPVGFNLDRHAGLGVYFQTMLSRPVFSTVFSQTPRRNSKNLRVVIVVENAPAPTFFVCAPRRPPATTSTDPVCAASVDDGRRRERWGLLVGEFMNLCLKVVVPQGEPVHPSEEVIEFYSMGKLKGPALQAFEEHLFICPKCQQGVTQMDFFLSMLQAAFSNPVPADAGTEGSGRARSRSEKRRDLRDACARLVSVRVLETTAATEPVVALLVNKSASGAAILARTHVPKGRNVLVRMAAFSKVGAVRYCVENGSLFQMGVEFQPNPAAEL